MDLKSDSKFYLCVEPKPESQFLKKKVFEKKDYNQGLIKVNQKLTGDPNLSSLELDQNWVLFSELGF